MLAIRLPEPIEARLTALAERTGRARPSMRELCENYARKAILAHLDDLEDLHPAEQQMTEFAPGRLKTIPLEEVLKQYRLKG